MWVTREFVDMLIREEVIMQSNNIDIAKMQVKTDPSIASIVNHFLNILPCKFEPYSEDDIIFGLYPDQIEQIKLYDVSGLTSEEVSRLVKVQLESMSFHALSLD